MYSYEIYWAHISSALSILSGIPYININAMLFPFLYLYITSLYLLNKAILHDFDEIYAYLSTILVLIFSGLFYIFNVYTNQVKISTFTYNGIYSFSYRSFAFFLLFISMALFIITIKTSKISITNSFIKIEEFTVIILVSFFLIQSYMTYFFPIILAISLFFIYYLFSEKKKEYFKLSKF